MGDESQTLTIDANTTNVNITDGVLACTQYTINVAAVNSAGNGDPSSENTTTDYEGECYMKLILLLNFAFIVVMII